MRTKTSIMLCCSRKSNSVGAIPRRYRLGAALRSAALSLSVLSGAMLSACEPANEIGLDVLPDEVPSTATYKQFSASVATVLRNDSVQTSNKGIALTGDLLDGNIGRTTAESYWQVRPISPNPTVPPVGALADSLVLTYGIGQFNGTADGRQKLEAYELADGFVIDKSYFAGSEGLTLGPKLGETTFKLRYARTRPTTKVLVYPWIVGDTTRKWADSVRTLQPIRFLVGTDLKQRLLDKIGKPEFLTLDAFLPVLKGVAIKPAGGTRGAIVGLDPKASTTRLTLYYHLPLPDTLKRTFVFSIGNAEQERHFTKIQTDYSVGEHLKPFYTPMNQAADTVMAKAANGFTAYLQGGLELGTRIRLIGLEALEAKRGRIAINRAELFIPVKPYATGVYPVLSQAYLLEVDANNRPLKANGQLRTVQTTGANPTGTAAPAVVIYDATQRAYRVLLTSYLDARINNKLLDQLGDAFWLLPTLPGANTLGLSRALIDGAADQVTLKVYYTELN